jgi:hypothetical protein
MTGAWWNVWQIQEFVTAQGPRRVNVKRIHWPGLDSLYKYDTYE